MAGKLGSLQDSQRQSYKEITDNSVTEIAQRVDSPNSNEKLDTIITNTTRQGTLTDRSGTATTTSAQIAAANSIRKYFYIQNVSAGTIWFNFGIAAVASNPSIKLEPGEAKEYGEMFISTETVNVIAQSATRAFTAKEG